LTRTTTDKAVPRFPAGRPRDPPIPPPPTGRAACTPNPRSREGGPL